MHGPHGSVLGTQSPSCCWSGQQSVWDKANDEHWDSVTGWKLGLLAGLGLSGTIFNGLGEENF